MRFNTVSGGIPEAGVRGLYDRIADQVVPDWAKVSSNEGSRSS
ncbi:hypothetical protein [Saccharothrix variisporea]|nr:hypothetical protein [Saccharothrix variisporea]